MDDLSIATTIGAGCSLDYVEAATKLKTETKVVGLWAWMVCPRRVPRINWITLPACDGGAPAYDRRGLEHRVLVHLDIHKDGTGESIVSKQHPWRSNLVDDESRPRDPRERISPPVRQHRRDDDDRRRDGERDHRGRDAAPSRSKGWGELILRSLSRSPRQEEQRCDDRDRGDRSRDERRCSLEPVQPTPALLIGSGSASDASTRQLKLQVV